MKQTMFVSRISWWFNHIASVKKWTTLTPLWWFHRGFRMGVCSIFHNGLFFLIHIFFWIFLFYIFVVHILSILIFKNFWIVYSYIVVLDFFSCLCFLISSLLCFFFYAHCWFYGLSNLAYKWECSLYRLKKINKNIKVLN